MTTTTGTLNATILSSPSIKNTNQEFSINSSNTTCPMGVCQKINDDIKCE